MRADSADGEERQGLEEKNVVALGGVVIVVNPFETTVTFVLVLGVLLVLKGAADLLVSLWLTSAMKQLQ